MQFFTFVPKCVYIITSLHKHFNSSTAWPSVFPQPEPFPGYIRELVETVSQRANFTPQYRNVTNYPNTAGHLTYQMVAGDVSVNAEREEFMDFSTSFMTIGLAIVFKKPAGPRAEIFSFLSPLSCQTWLQILASYILVSLLLFLLSSVLEDPCPR